MASGIKSDVAQKLIDLNVSTFSMTPVKVSDTFAHAKVLPCYTLTVHNS